MVGHFEKWELHNNHFITLYGITSFPIVVKMENMENPVLHSWFN